MKNHSILRTLLWCACATVAIVACFTAPRALLNRADAKLLQSPQPRSAVEGPLSSEGRDNLLASMLYAQAHFLTEAETNYIGQNEPTEETALADGIRTLQNANVLPQDITPPSGALYKSVKGQLTAYYADSSESLSLETATGKIVSFSWQGDSTYSTDILSSYLAYLELDAYDWQQVESTAQSITVSAVYSSSLQLYVCVTSDTRTDPDYHVLNCLSMTAEQLQQITVA